jgi:hypothetical protein
MKPIAFALALLSSTAAYGQDDYQAYHRGYNSGYNDGASPPCCNPLSDYSKGYWNGRNDSIIDDMEYPRHRSFERYRDGILSPKDPSENEDR